MPYEGELPGTDALVAYDRILGWDGLPKDITEALRYAAEAVRERELPLRPVG